MFLSSAVLLVYMLFSSAGAQSVTTKGGTQLPASGLEEGGNKSVAVDSEGEEDSGEGQSSVHDSNSFASDEEDEEERLWWEGQVNLIRN